jgi:hypothetical protein
MIEDDQVRLFLAGDRMLREELGGGSPPPFVASWIEERCDRGRGLLSLSRDLYADFMQWAKGTGVLDQVGSTPIMKLFSEWLKILKLFRWRHPQNRRHGFEGIALKTAAPLLDS